MKKLVFILFAFVSIAAYSQDKKIDQLEILYDQGYYHKVLRKAEKLLAKPEYDYSGLPSFYRALSLLRMASDERWFRRRRNTIEVAIKAYDDFLENENREHYLAAHYHEIASIKTYLVDLETKFSGKQLNKEAELIQDFRMNQLKGIKPRPDFKPNKDDDSETEVVAENLSESEAKQLSFRQKMVVYAKSLVGVKYVWAGSDPNGFDCSGFVGYVHRKYGLVIPRTASAQMKGAKKVKTKEAFLGDLLFFSSGSGISHVGLVISNKGEDLVMVHASTSKGVIITEIEKSTYWKPRLKSAGTFI
ncbi:MAG: C40 family peptidase [Crocinitomicaceae bacterium]